MLPHMYSWPAAHFCYPGWTGIWHLISDTLHFSLSFFPLPSFPSSLSHSHQSQVCTSLSHALALVRLALLSAKPQIWGMGNERTDTHAHLNKHSHTDTHIKHTQLYLCIMIILGYKNSDRVNVFNTYFNSHKVKTIVERVNNSISCRCICATKLVKNTWNTKKICPLFGPRWGNLKHKQKTYFHFQNQ